MTIGMLTIVFPKESNVSTENDISFIKPQKRKQSRSDTLGALMEAQIQVESTGNPNAYNRKEDAVGILQIRPIMVREINRQLGMAGMEKRFTLSDRWSDSTSRNMWWTYVNLVHKDHSPERIARCWNGGGNGHKKQSTQIYWNKVKSLMYAE
jgi:hypothetical protein